MVGQNPMSLLCENAYAVRRPVSSLAFITALIAPDSSSIKRVVAGNPRALFSTEAVSVGTETIFMEVVEVYHEKRIQHQQDALRTLKERDITEDVARRDGI